MSDDIIVRAHAFALRAHGDQTRKYTGDPYIVHPGEVARLVALAMPLDHEVIAAAWLHDVVEDCDIAPSVLNDAFGARVARLVLEVSDVATPADGNRKRRKEIEREHLASASYSGQTIKLADIIDNTKSIVRYDPGFAKVYLEEKALLLPLLIRGDHALHSEARRLLVKSQEDLLSAALADQESAR